ncbi:uncharacterized protein LOC143289458 [Babylonia areolata]|uniref:uncharacterized protein LOC143289458 n=1 Tax=Babylonia areolata TaxID=304850 RepID=UPI003FCFABF1
MSQKGKTETGAELLARLGPRPSLHGLEVSEVLGFEPSPGDILELYGGEGVGKTELLLHLVTSALVPPCSSSAGCDMTEVVWVDCDLKFSVLRLAVLLEQCLMKKQRRQQREPCHRRTATSSDSCSLMSSKSSKPCGTVNCEHAQSFEACDDVVNRAVSEGGEGCKFGGGRTECRSSHANSHDTDKKSESRDKKDKTDNDEVEKKNSKKEKCGSDMSFKAQDSHPSESEGGVKPDSSKQTPLLHESDAAIPSVSSETLKSGSAGRKRKAEDMDSDSFVSHQGSKAVRGENVSEAASCNKNSVQTVDKIGESLIKVPETEHPIMGGGEMERKEEANIEMERVEEEAICGEEMERMVEGCLRRVHVLRCTSSQQLVCTLHSVQSLVAANPNVALLVIDPVSAFYWSDRGSDFQHTSSLLHRNIAQVVSVLKTVTASYNVLVLTSKQALMKSKTKKSSINSPAKGSSGEDTHMEFLGQAWGRAVTRRLVCSKSVCQHRGVRVTQYTLSGNTGQKRFIIDESGVCLLDH